MGWNDDSNTPLTLNPLLLFTIGTLLLVDCIYLVTVQVTHVGVTVPLWSIWCWSCSPCGTGVGRPGSPCAVGL